MVASSRDGALALAEHAPTTQALADVLLVLGPERAEPLRADDLAATLDGAGTRRLLESSTGHVPWRERRWFKVAARLCSDPELLAGFTREVLADHSSIGWLNGVDAAAVLVDNPALPGPVRYQLMALKNPYQQPDTWRAALETPVATLPVASALLTAGCRLKSPGRFLAPLLRAPQLGAGTAQWALTQLTRDCVNVGPTALEALLERGDLLEVLARLEPGTEPGPDGVSTTGPGRRRWSGLPLRCALWFARSGHTWSTTARSCRPCGRRSTGSRLTPALPEPARLYPVLRSMWGGASALSGRTDLPVEAYTDLAEAAVVSRSAPVLHALANNPACPPRLLLDAPASVVGAGTVARLGSERFADRAGAYAMLARLIDDDRVTNLTVAAVLELPNRSPPEDMPHLGRPDSPGRGVRSLREPRPSFAYPPTRAYGRPNRRSSWRP